MITKPRVITATSSRLNPVPLKHPAQQARLQPGRRQASRYTTPAPNNKASACVNRFSCFRIQLFRNISKRYPSATREEVAQA